MKCIYSKKEEISEIQVVSQELEQEKNMVLPLTNILDIFVYSIYLIFYHPKTFAEFNAASSNACLGSLTPK